MKKATYMATIALTLLGTAGLATSVNADEVTDKAQQVIRGEFGNGQTRKDKLGKDYTRIQTRVNEILGLNTISSVGTTSTAITAPTTEESINVPTVEQPAVTTNQSNFSTASVSAQTQYSHTENGHVEGGYYYIASSVPNVVNSGSGKTVSGTVTRSGIGLEKGTINLAYVLNFDSNGVYTSGSVTSSGYVNASINLAVGQNYTGQSVNFLHTTGGYAGSGSYIYPISATLNLG